MVHAATTIIDWVAPEYLYRPRRIDWYWWLGIVCAVAIAGSIIIQNYWLTVFIALGGFLLGAMASNKPKDIRVVISEVGIQVDNKLHLFQDLDAFWVETGPGRSTPIWVFVVAALVTLVGGGYAVYEKEWGALIFIALALALVLFFLIQKKPPRGTRLLLHSENHTGLPIDSIIINTDQVDPLEIRDILSHFLAEVELREPFMLRIAHRMGIA